MRFPSSVALSLALAASPLCFAATRPHYGGKLRVEMRAAIETADPPQSGPGMADLATAFSVTRWEGGRSASYSAAEDASGGRPYLDSVEILMGRSYRDQAIDLELGRADIVELGINELRRAATTPRRIWTSEPVRLLALVFGPQVTDIRIREALALAVDRSAIHNVLLQRQGEIAGSLLPQWVSGYAFLFPTAADPAKARSLVASIPPASRTVTLAVEDTDWRFLADRIVLNARDAGLAVSTGTPTGSPDLRFVELRITSTDPAQALVSLAASLGLPEPQRPTTPDAIFHSERSYLADFKVIPLFHLPLSYGVGPRVRGGPGITPLGEWKFENLWLESSRP